MSTVSYSNHVLDAINIKYPNAGVVGIRIVTERPGLYTWLVVVGFADGLVFEREVDGDSDSHKVLNVNRAIRDIVIKKTQKAKPASAYHA